MDNQNYDGNSYAIKMRNLTKYYGEIKGIENVSLEVKKGQIFGFLGPNGAGKTTTIRILIGLIRPTDGEAEIFGSPVGSIESKHKIGYLPSDFELYNYYTIKEYLDYIEKLRGHAELKEDLIELFDVDIYRKTSELSRGNKQKVAIVQALMHDPDILIADEPTTGLDPVMQDIFNKYLKNYIKRGGTAFISSHILRDIQEICDSVTIIKSGHIFSSGTVSELLENLPKKAILSLNAIENAGKVLATLNLKSSEVIRDKLVIYYDQTHKEIMKIIIDNPNVVDFSFPDPSLEEYFLPIFRS
ncbi:MAG: putative ABC transporter ATP-binding protein YbhF [Candidatus Heimdallarchaeota archaeon LC_2]|nr:MAG: putative ABC transporter ATP-binding protein YbhF [Candidatus Heimdallarchaeota archaeon LC_2]